MNLRNLSPVLMSFRQREKGEKWKQSPKTTFLGQIEELRLYWVIPIDGGTWWNYVCWYILIHWMDWLQIRKAHATGIVEFNGKCKLSSYSQDCSDIELPATRVIREEAVEFIIPEHKKFFLHSSFFVIFHTLFQSNFHYLICCFHVMGMRN